MTPDSSPLRVLLACDFFLRYTAKLAGGIECAGADAVLLTRDHDEEFGGTRGAAARFVSEATAGGACVRVRGRVRSPHGLDSALSARQAVRGFAPDVVHLQAGIGNDPRLIFAAGARPGGFALTVHDPVRHPGERVSRSAALGNRALLRTAGLIFVHAAALQDELAEAAKLRAPIVVVPHGIDPAETRAFPELPTILFFGRLGHYKGLDVLLDAMGPVWERLPQARLTIAGAGELEDHPALADPRVAVRAEHIPDDELAGLFAAATCVALPYRQASQSGVGSLAKRYGRGLVVSAVGGLPELVSDGSGLVVAAEDPAALAAALQSVLADRDLAARLGQAASETAAGGSDWRSVAEMTLSAYEEYLLRQRRRGP